MAELMGKQTAKLQHPPQVESFAACVGKKEGEGPLGTPVSYTHLTLPTTLCMCRSRWSPYH